jgi:hypothetical protein
MADFKTVLLNKTALIEAFLSLNVAEATKAKQNIEEAIDSLRLPTQELLDLMKAQNLSFEDFSVGSDTPKPERKKRELKVEKQNFTHKDNELVLLVSRAVSKARDEGFTVVSFSELSSEDQTAAKDLVDSYNS